MFLSQFLTKAVYNQCVWLYKFKVFLETSSHIIVSNE